MTSNRRHSDPLLRHLFLIFFSLLIGAKHHQNDSATAAMNWTGGTRHRVDSKATKRHYYNRNANALINGSQQQQQEKNAQSSLGFDMLLLNSGIVANAGNASIGDHEEIEKQTTTDAKRRKISPSIEDLIALIESYDRRNQQLHADLFQLQTQTSLDLLSIANKQARVLEAVHQQDQQLQKIMKLLSHDAPATDVVPDHVESS